LQDAHSVPSSGQLHGISQNSSQTSPGMHAALGPHEVPTPLVQLRPSALQAEHAIH
jgi:hypothetical protein